MIPLLAPIEHPRFVFIGLAHFTVSLSLSRLTSQLEFPTLEIKRRHRFGIKWDLGPLFGIHVEGAPLFGGA